MNTIKRDVYVLRNTIKIPIEVTKGTDAISFEFTVRDYNLPATAAAVAYAYRMGMKRPNSTLCDVSGNVISFQPSANFFEVGNNELQIRVINEDKSLISFKEKVKCSDSMGFPDEEEEADQSLIEQIIAQSGKESGERKAADALERSERIEADAKEKSERSKEIATERARIDQLTKMGEGSTTGDAELQDIRVGNEGATYSNAGNAVRSQTKDVPAMMDNLQSPYVDISLLEQGSLNNTGTEITSSKVLRSVEFHWNKNGKITAPSGYKIAIANYAMLSDESGQMLQVYQSVTDYGDSQTSPKADGDTKFRRLLIKRSDGADINAEDLRGKITTNVPGLRAMDVIENLEKKIKTDTTLKKEGIAADAAETGKRISKVEGDIGLLNEDLNKVDDAIKGQIVIPTKKGTLNSYTGYSEEIAKVSENERWIVAFSEYNNRISIRNLKSSWVDQSDAMNQDNNTCEINITANGSLRVNAGGISYTGSYIAFNTTGNDKLHTFILNNGINSNAKLYDVNQYIENYMLKNEQNVSEKYITSIDELTNSNSFVEHTISPSSSGTVPLRTYNDTLKKYRFDVNKQKKYVVVVDVNIRNDSGTTIGSFYTTEGLQIRYPTGAVGLNCSVLDTDGYYREGNTANFVYSIPSGTSKNVRIIGKFSAENLEFTSVYWTLSLNRFRLSGSSANIVSGITSKVLNCWVFEDTGYSNYQLKNYVGKRTLSEDVIVKNADHASHSDKIKTIFEGKKVVTYGDSITANGGWQDYLRTYFDCTIVNKGIGGTTVANNGAENYFCLQSRIDTIPQDTDVVIVMGGTNDCGQSIEIGDLTYSNGFDTTKFKGGLATTIRMIQNRCPNALIFVASLCGGRGNTAGENLDTPVYNSKNLTSYDYAKATKDVAEFFNIQYIPIFEECGINCWNRATYIADTVHPNDYGKKQLAKIFIKHLSSYLIS